MPQRTQRLIESAKKLPVPEGTWAVGAGLIISGITAYMFQILSFRGLSKTDYTALNGLWIFVFVIAPGSSSRSSRRSAAPSPIAGPRGIGGGPVVRKAAIAGGRAARRR